MTPEKAKEMNEERAMENGESLAFPFISNYEHHQGLTKREWMAAQIMSGLLSYGHDTRTAVGYSVNAVDELLIELGKSKN